MTAMTEQETTKVILESAAALAKKLGMRRKNDMTSLRFGQPVMMVTAFGTTIGNIRSTHGREDDYRYDLYILENTKLCSYTFNRLPGSSEEDPAWEETPIIEMTLPEGAILYAGRVPKDTRKSTRKSGYRY